MAGELLPVELPLLVQLRDVRKRTSRTRADGVGRLQLSGHRRDGLVCVAYAAGSETLDWTLVIGTFEGEGGGGDFVAVLDVLVGMLFSELSNDTAVQMQKRMNLVFASQPCSLCRRGWFHRRLGGLLDFVLVITLAKVNEGTDVL